MNKEFLLSISDDYERALYLVSELFKDKTDKNGFPYINHLIRVSIKLDSKELKIAGLLHDVLEDTKVTSDDLREYGFTDRIIEIVEAVTNQPIGSYHDKIRKIVSSGDIDVIKLKYADMSDNFDSNRLKLLPVEVQRRLTLKYKDNLEMLKGVLDNEKVKNRTRI